MNTLEIENFAQSNKFTSKFFIGCFAADKIPLRKITARFQPECFVVNLCDAYRTNDPSCHWILVWVTRNTSLVFDSGGGSSHTTNEHIKKFLQMQTKKKVISNKIQIQSYQSDLCGRFVLTFMFAKSIGVGLRKYQNMFHKTGNLDRNDRIVNAIFKKAFLDSQYDNDG